MRVRASPKTEGARLSALYTFKCYRSHPVCKGAERGGRVDRALDHIYPVC
jgi:hypothetical protein